jgi:DNA-binding HxlR family transcriptional regulator
MDKQSTTDAPSSDEEKCHMVMGVLADPIILEVLDCLSSQPMRFTGLQRATKSNPVTLTKRLRNMENLSLIRRIEESIDKQSVLYELLPLGEDCLPAVRAMRACATAVAVGLDR